MLSRRYKTIFIHVPKCAGTTVERYFRELGASLWQNTFPYGSLRTHNLARVINLYPDYFSFAFVRNPFDRFISYYLFGLLKQQQGNEPVGYNNIQECIELTEELLSLPPNARYSRDHGRASQWYAQYHCLPQTTFLLDHNPSHFFGVPRRNDAPCSFIGRQESFARDFSLLLDILKAPKIPEKIEHAYNKQNRRHYSHYYDKTTRRRVEDAYARDLEVLGYEFEQEGTISVLNPLYDLPEARKERNKKIKLPLRIYCNRVWIYSKGVKGAIKMVSKKLLRKMLRWFH